MMPPRLGDKAADSYNVNRSLQHYDGAFDESFGAQSTLQNEWGECITDTPQGPYKNIPCTGQWNPAQMIQASLYVMRNATMIDKKSLCVHTFKSEIEKQKDMMQSSPRHGLKEKQLD